MLGAVGTAFTVTLEPAEIQVVSVVDRTRNVYVPGATPVKVALDWYVVPLILYPTPDWVVKTIVPVVVAHVGCTVTLPTGVSVAVTVNVLVVIALAQPPVPVTV